jgi:hypothetical protein
MADTLKLLADRVNYRALLMLIPISAFGTGFLFWSQLSEGWHHPIRAVVLREIGVLLFATVALTLLWDLVGKRAFADEILAKANMSRDLADAGINVFTADFRDHRIPWPELFKCSNKLDIFVSYASTWRNIHLSEIEHLLSRRDGRVRVILSDPENDDLLEVLAKRFGKEKEFLKKQIEESIKFWQERNQESKAGKDDKDKVEIYLTPIAPFFTFYLFTAKAVAAFYNHRMGRIPVPAFVCDEEGYMFRYLSEEFEGIRANAKSAKPADIQQ